MRLRLPAAFALSLLPCTDAAGQAAPNESLTAKTISDEAWSRYRGPNGQGVASAPLLPRRAKDLVPVWRIPFAAGHSSPVVFEKRVYLTREGKERGIREVVCLALGSGKELWSTSFRFEEHRQHRFNSFASSTPAVDASGIYITWVSGRELQGVALAKDGTKRWQKTLGRFAAAHGYGNSAVLAGDILLIANENEGEESCLLGVDKATGETRWRIARESTRKRGSYATPILVGGDDSGVARAALFASTKHGLAAVDPASGKMLWEHPLGFSYRFCATPVVEGDRILAFAGSGGSGKDCALIRMPQRGAREAHEVARPRRNLPYVPCAVALPKRFFLVSDGGIASCMDASSGETIWRERLDGSFFASPISNGSTIFVPDREGTLHSFAATDRFEDASELELGAQIFATPAIAENSLVVRTKDSLQRLAARAQDTARAQDKAKSTQVAKQAPAVADKELRSFAQASARKAGAIDENWPSFLGLRRDSKSRETGLLAAWPETGPKLLWERERGEGFACPILHDGRLVHVHRLGQDMVIDCLEAESGRKLWRFRYPCRYTKDRYIQNGGQRSAPVVHEGRVYVHGVGGMMHCLELATGKLVWKRDVGRDYDVGPDYFGVVSSPLVYGDYLIQNLGGDQGHTVAAFELATGKLAWGTGVGWGQSCSSPTIGKVHGRDRVFVLAGGMSRPPTGGLLVVDPKNGEVDFRYPFRSRRFESVNGAPPAVGADWVFLSVSYGVGSAILDLDEKGGFKERWRARSPALQFQNAVVDGDRIYCIDGNSRTGSFVCLDRSGKTLYREELVWEERIELDGQSRAFDTSVAEGALLQVDGALLCLGAFGHLLRIVPGEKSMEVTERHWLFRARQSWTPPVVHRGLLYLCQNQSSSYGGPKTKPRLLCYDLRAQ